MTLNVYYERFIYHRGKQLVSALLVFTSAMLLTWCAAFPDRLLQCFTFCTLTASAFSLE